MIDLDELERLCREATPGPWKMVRIANTTLSIVAPWSDQVTTKSEGWGDYRGIHIATIKHHSGDGAVSKEHAEANARLIAAAPELKRQADALHAAVCQAVALLNVCQEIGRTPEGYEAHAILRQTLIDYAAAMQEQKP